VPLRVSTHVHQVGSLASLSLLINCGSLFTKTPRLSKDAFLKNLITKDTCLLLLFFASALPVKMLCSSAEGGVPTVWLCHRQGEHYVSHQCREDSCDVQHISLSSRLFTSSFLHHKLQHILSKNLPKYVMSSFLRSRLEIHAR
jgi:hypothetical protein